MKDRIDDNMRIEYPSDAVKPPYSYEKAVEGIMLTVRIRCLKNTRNTPQKMIFIISTWLLPCSI